MIQVHTFQTVNNAYGHNVGLRPLNITQISEIIALHTKERAIKNTPSLMIHGASAKM